MRTRKLLALLAVAILIAAFVPARSDEPAKQDDPCKTTDGKKTVACQEKEQAEARADAKSQAVAFTNDDLDRMFGASHAPAKSVEQIEREKGGAQPDYLAAQREQQEKAAVTGQAVELAKARVAEAEQRVKDLEARTIQIANPLLPRPQLSPEEQKAWQGMDNAERMKQNQAEIEAAKAAAAQAQQDLEKAQSGGE